MVLVVRHSMIYIYIYMRFYVRETLFIYMHNMYNLYRKIPANKKELNGKHKINGKKPKPPKHLVPVGATKVMVYQHPGLARATWWHFSAGSCRTGSKGGAFSLHSLVLGVEPALKSLTNRR